MSIHVGIEASTWWNERGFGRFTRSLVTALLARDSGFSYTLIVDRPAGDSLPAGARVLEAPATGSVADGLALGRAVAGQRFDLMFYPAVHAWAPVLPGTPSLVTFHDTHAEQYPKLSFAHWHERIAWQLKCAAARRSARRILTVSESSARALHEHFGIARDRLDVTTEAAASVFARCQDPAALTAVREQHAVPEGAPLLVYAGGFNPHKNVAGLLRAMTRVFARHPDVQLLAVGDTSGQGFFENVSELLHLAQQPELRGRVSFPGFVPDAELALLLSAATAFVFPSLCEGFGLPVLEAMACGAPVIVSDRASLPEVAGVAGAYFDPERPEQMAASIDRVLGDPALRERMRAAGLARHRELTWERSAQLVEQSFRRTLAG